MPEKTKQKKDGQKRVEKEAENTVAETPETDEKGTWSDDQKEKSYYYDDSYGYEVYNPEDDNEDA